MSEEIQGSISAENLRTGQWIERQDEDFGHYYALSVGDEMARMHEHLRSEEGVVVQAREVSYYYPPSTSLDEPQGKEVVMVFVVGIDPHNLEEYDETDSNTEWFGAYPQWFEPIGNDRPRTNRQVLPEHATHADVQTVQQLALQLNMVLEPRREISRWLHRPEFFTLEDAKASAEQLLKLAEQYDMNTIRQRAKWDIESNTWSINTSDGKEDE